MMQFGAVINKSGLGTASCVIPNYCGPLYMNETRFKVHLSCARYLRDLDFFGGGWQRKENRRVVSKRNFKRDVKMY